MFQVLILSLVTTSSAFTTHRYDTYENYGNQRPIVPLRDNIFEFVNGNGQRPVQNSEYPKGYDGVVKLSDNVFNQSPVFNSEEVHRRVDTHYNYQYPYQRYNGQDAWNRIAVAEATKFSNRFKDYNQDRKYSNVFNTDTNDRRGVVQQDSQEGVMKQMNKTQGNDNIAPVSIQLNDVSGTSVINEQLITSTNDHRKQKQSFTKDNANLTTRRSINSDNNTNSIHLYMNKDEAIAITNRNGSTTLTSVRLNTNSINNSNVSHKETPDKIYRPTKTNNRTDNNTKTNKFNETNNNNDGNQPNNTVVVNNSTKYDTKTTQDNEVTPRPQKGKTAKDSEDDRWIWSNSEDQKVETTTLFDLGDRAAFSGNGCPDGKVKVGNACVVPD